MQLCKIQLAGGAVRAGVVEAGQVRFLSGSLSDVLHAVDVLNPALQPGALIRTQHQPSLIMIKQPRSSTERDRTPSLN